MRHILTTLLILLASAGVFSQEIKIIGLNDTAALKIKLKEYTAKLRAADAYEAKAQAELQKVDFFQKEAKAWLDSAKLAANKAQLDRFNSQYYLMKYNMYYNNSTKFSKQSDSILKVATTYKDTANLMNKGAQTFYMTIAEEFKNVLRYDTVYTATFVVQLGAGKMDRSFFNKVSDVEIVTPSDGIKRYITGRFGNKEEALEHQKKMIALGYKDAFIRTAASLDY